MFLDFFGTAFCPSLSAFRSCFANGKLTSSASSSASSKCPSFAVAVCIGLRANKIQHITHS